MVMLHVPLLGQNGNVTCALNRSKISTHTHISAHPSVGKSTINFVII